MQVYIVTISDKYGIENAVFSTEAAANAHAFKRAREIWQERRAPINMPEDDDADFWSAFGDEFDDCTVEQDRAVIDAETAP